MVNLTDEQRDKIIELSELGYSQNKIALETGISKPYVNQVLQGVRGLGTVQPKPPQPHTYHSRPEEWAMPNANAAELHYTKLRLQDTEKANRDLVEEVQRLKGEFATLQTKHNQLEIEHKSIEAKHQYEKDNMLSQHKFSQNNSLNGLADKFLNNDKLVNGLMTFLMAKANGNNQPQPSAQPQQPTINHPLANDPKTGTEIQEIYQVLAMFKADQISDLHTLMGALIQYPEMIKITTQKIVEFVNKKQNPSPAAE